MANDILDKVSIRVDGFDHFGWTNISMSKSIDDLSGVADFSVVQAVADSRFTRLPKLIEGKNCSVVVNGVTAITGRIEQRVATLTRDHYGVDISVRSLTGSLVDSHHIDTTAEYRSLLPSQIVERVLRPFDLSVKNLLDGKEEKIPIFRYRVGDTAREIINQVCRVQGISVFDDEDGAVVLGKGRQFGSAAGVLEYGNNIKEATVTRDISKQFSEYHGKGMIAPDDRNRGKFANQNSAILKNENLKHYKPIVILGEGSMDAAAISKRIEHEAARRAGESLEVSVTVAGWSVNGNLWIPGKMANTVIENEGVNQRLLIKSVNYSQTPEDGTTCNLTLSPKESYDDAAKSGKTLSKRKKRKKAKPKYNIEEFGKIDLTGGIK